MPILTLGVGDIFVCHDILFTQDTNSSTGYVRRCDVFPVASVVKTVLMSLPCVRSVLHFLRLLASRQDGRKAHGGDRT